MPPTMQIFFKMLDGKTITMVLRPEDTIENVKLILFNRPDVHAQLPVQAQLRHGDLRLLFAGKELEDDRTLSSYNIHTRHDLHLLLHVRGGGRKGTKQ